jgi:lactate dehydrogenase-like 2-hydroxyacid dehydrogenase
MGGELRGACIGIIGYGEIGRHVARLAQAFGMRVCVYTILTFSPQILTLSRWDGMNFWPAQTMWSALRQQRPLRKN